MVMYYAEKKGPSTKVTKSMEGDFKTPKEAVVHFKKLFGDRLLIVYSDDGDGFVTHYEAK